MTGPLVAPKAPTADAPGADTAAGLLGAGYTRFLDSVGALISRLASDPGVPGNAEASSKRRSCRFPLPPSARERVLALRFYDEQYTRSCTYTKRPGRRACPRRQSAIRVSRTRAPSVPGS